MINNQTYNNSQSVIYPVIIDQPYPELFEFFGTELTINIGGRIEKKTVQLIKNTWGKMFFLQLNPEQRCVDLTLTNLLKIECLNWDEDESSYFFTPVLCVGYTKNEETKDILTRNFYEHTDDIKTLLRIM